MFYTIGQHKDKPDRKTERTDARQELLRHNPDQHQSNKQARFKEDPEDKTAVSIDSLILFLQTALPKTSSDIFGAASKQTPKRESAPGSQSHKAADAYQSAAGQNTTPPTSQNAANALPEMSAQDIQTITVLIKDLSDLKNRGGKFLTIAEGENFLDSLVHAIQRAQ